MDALVAQLVAIQTQNTAALNAMQNQNNNVLNALTVAITTAQNAPAQQAPAAAPTPASCVLPPFTLNAADPHFVKNWFAHTEMVLQLYT
uniref:Uncharacterized protein n=1 Tax=Panagrolaimus superbus TaxID=310955 RepID=A0A914YNH2_9BILA